MKLEQGIFRRESRPIGTFEARESTFFHTQFFGDPQKDVHKLKSNFLKTNFFYEKNAYHATHQYHMSPWIFFQGDNQVGHQETLRS